MGVTVELKDYSIHIENFVMIALEKENSLQNIWFSYCSLFKCYIFISYFWGSEKLTGTW